MLLQLLIVCEAYVPVFNVYVRLYITVHHHFLLLALLDTYPPPPRGFKHVLCVKARRHCSDRSAAPSTGQTEVQYLCHGEYIKALRACKLSAVANSILLSTFLLLQSISPGLVETEMVPEEFLKKSPYL